MKLKKILMELSDEPSVAVNRYLPKESFDKFQASLQTIINSFTNDIKKRVLGREVTFSGSKGYGQVIHTYTAFIQNIEVVLYKEKYLILFHGTEGKSETTDDYYIDPTDNIYMKIHSGGGHEDPTEPEENPNGNDINAPKPPVRPAPKPAAPIQPPAAPAGAKPVNNYNV